MHNGLKPKEWRWN